jgi:hypothetical protein
LPQPRKRDEPVLVDEPRGDQVGGQLAVDAGLELKVEVVVGLVEREAA